jgi:hypothetical protein
MLNFLVTLVNKIGIPVVLVGTTPAMEILQSEFRQARRSSGIMGDLLWDKMENDASWDIFVSSMWRYQWTRQKNPASDEFKEALYHESQGIADIAVKLYAMAQMRAIGLQTDVLAPGDFRVVASEKLGLVKFALDALRSGDKKRIAAIGDIEPISVDDYYAAYSAMLPPITEDIFKKSDKITIPEQAVLKLLEMDIEPMSAKRLVGKAMAGDSGKKTLAEVVRKAFTLYVVESDSKDQSADERVAPGDIRKANDYEGMKAAGLVGNPL